MIAIIDYDAGNLKSVEKALKYLGQDVIVSRDSSEILQADKVILPGVGSFGDAMNNLDHFNLVDTIKKVAEKDTPFLGICLGLQLLFEKSDETPGAEGLGILKGEILRIPPKEGLKIPHMGWNSLNIKPQARLFDGIANNSYVYFVHSYRAETSDDYISCYTTYNEKIPGLVFHNNIYGAQFHPEKSGQVGMTILKNFAKLVTK